MPGFSYRKVQWGPSGKEDPVAPAHFIKNASFITNPTRHRIARNFTPSRLIVIRATVATPETEAFIPYFLTHLKTNRRDVHPLAPPPIPSIHHLPFLYARNTHVYKYIRAKFFKLPKLEDPGPPATTRPLGFRTQLKAPHRANFGIGYLFGIGGGDAVGPIPDRPKFYRLRGVTGKKRRKTGYTFKTWFPKFLIVPVTDKIYAPVKGLPKAHKFSRGFTRFKYIPKFVPTVTNYLSLIEFFNLRIRLDVKKAVDSGTVSALSSDVGGTVVTFNRPFKDIDSIVCTVQETTEFITVIDFVDIPNPTQFKILVFTTAGVRASKQVRWVARNHLMEFEVDGEKIVLYFSSEEKKVLLNYYSGITAVGIALKKPIQEWIDARLKMFNEAQEKDFISKFKNLSTDRQNEILAVMGRNESINGAGKGSTR